MRVMGQILPWTLHVFSQITIKVEKIVFISPLSLMQLVEILLLSMMLHVIWMIGQYLSVKLTRYIVMLEWSAMVAIRTFIAPATKYKIKQRALIRLKLPVSMREPS